MDRDFLGSQSGDEEPDANAIVTNYYNNTAKKLVKFMKGRDTSTEMKDHRDNYDQIRSDMTGRKKPVSMYQITRQMNIEQKAILARDKEKEKKDKDDLESKGSKSLKKPSTDTNPLGENSRYSKLSKPSVDDIRPNSTTNKS